MSPQGLDKPRRGIRPAIKRRQARCNRRQKIPSTFATWPALFGRFDQLDAPLQDQIDEVAQGDPARLGARSEKGQHGGVEMHWRRQHRVGAIEPAASGFGEIVFVLHGMGFSRY